MGVSLERVQFKFASIIGELCNEPDVLSQFAVWLDIRLAEYKLKGAISLDCSGEEPEADWMNGLSKCKKYSANKQKDRQSSLHSSLIANSSSKYEQDFHLHVDHHNEKLSPEFVVVKEETSEIFPVEVHMHSDTSPLLTHGHKRSSFSHDWSRNSVGTPTKQRRQNISESPSHQSLMSVIGNTRDETQESGSKGNNSSSLPSNSFTLSEQVRDSNQTLDPLKTPEIVTVNLSDEGSWTETSTSADGTTNTNMDPACKGHSIPGNRPGSGIPHIEAIVNVDEIRPSLLSLHNPACLVSVRKSRLGDVSMIPRKSVTNMVAAVGYFERWLWTSPHRDLRWITEIPVELLDPYLEEFFMTIKTPMGTEYTAVAFVAFRAYISRYLKHSGYPEIITTSELFPKSQAAFRMRRRELQLNQKLESSEVRS